jgi:fatty acid synthase subunit alpha
MSGLNFVLSHPSLTTWTSSPALLVLLPLSSPQTLLEAQELRLVFDAHELLQIDDGSTDHEALRLRLIVGFLAFLLESTTTSSSVSSTSRFVVSRATRDELLHVTFEALNKAVINDAEDVHIVLKNKPEALRIYLHARHELAIKKTSSSELPFLLRATPSSFGGYSKMAMSSHIQEEQRRKGVAFVQFGGQGSSYFDELRKTFRMYPEAKKLISSSLESLTQELKKRKDELDPYTLSMVDTLFLQGNLLKWLSTSDASTVKKERLSDVALAYAPLSYPLICLTQLSGCFTYLSHLLEKLFFSSSSSSTLEKLLLDAFHRGATGHSQGICAAVVFASSKTTEEFVENTSKMIRYLFWQGYRSQLKFNSVSSASSTLDSSSTSGSSSSSLSSTSRSSPSSSSSPTPMMAVLKLPVAEVSRRITEFNKRKTNPSELLDLALVNGPTATVLASGSVESLKEFDKILRTPPPAPTGGKAPPPLPAEINRDRIPFSRRKSDFLTVFLMVSAPFHCPSIMTQDVADAIVSDLRKSGLETAFESKSLLVPVFSTFDGSDLRIVSSSSPTEVSPLLLELIHLQSSKRVNWASALSSATLEKGVRCIIDFGPTAEGSATLSARVKDGQGIQVIQASEYELSSSTSLEESATNDNMVLGKEYLFADSGSRLESAFRGFYAQNTRHWFNEFSPRLVKVRSGNDKEKLMIDTKFSRLIGKPPVMVAGMTPTTVSVDFVAAILNAGFHVELAGGGLVRETIFRQSIDRLMDLCVNNGEGICLNLLFLNAKQWSFQFPLIKQLVKVEGVPIESITIAAGLPTLEKANEIVEELREVGVRYISFKPSSITTILETITIAKANPKMQFVLQWTGGRAGGHHSFEDAHQPILETYSQIRRTPNLSLIMGSGLGNAESALPYITGEWSTPAYPAMPFDGVMLASRVMIAKEADTSLPVKEMISKVKGVTNELDWEQSYETSAGGIVTVLSELDEAIHVVENRCTLLWRELDKKIFSLPLGEQEKALQLNKSWIIQRLNSDYQKLYFPIFKKQTNETSTAELSGMTYEEIARRLVELMYILPSTSTNSKRTGWIDPSFCELTLAFLHRIEERFFCSGASVLSLEKLWKEPHALLQEFFDKYTLSKEQLVFPQDVDFFLSLCAPLPTRRGKPVNFVPVIDKNFKYYFKKDSLWYSEFIEAVPHQDPQRAFVLQGPVAVRYSNIVNEEVKHIISTVTQDILDRLATTQQTSTLNIVDYLRLEGTAASEIQDTTVISSHNSEATVTLELLKDGVTIDKWMTTILAEITQRTNSKTSWIQALLSSTTIVRGKRRVDNSIRQLFAPLKSKRVVVTFDKANTSRVEVFQDMILAFTLSYTNAIITLNVVYSIPGTASQSDLSLHFKYCPEHPYSLIQEDPTQRCQSVKNFYSKVWSISDISHNEITQDSRFTYNFTSEPYVVTRKELQEFCSSTSLRLVADSNSQLQVPFDFAIVVAWTPLVKALFVDVLSHSQTDLLDLVHLSNSYKRCEPLVYVKEGDVLSTTLHLVKISNSKSGKMVTVRGVISKLSTAGTQHWIELESTFFIRGHFFDHVNSFREEQTTYRLVLEKEREIALITSKPWILLPGNTLHYTLDNLLIPDYQLEDLEDDDPSEMDLKDTLLPEDELTFDLFVQEKYFDESKLSNVHVSGPITRIRTGKGGVKEKTVIGKLDYSFSSSSPLEYLTGNIPLEFLKRLQATTLAKEHSFESGYHLLSEVQVYNAPLENLPYALASRDYNPIHMNKSISVLANLPDTIVHGMWTSAYAKSVLEDYVSRINLVESRKANGWQDITEYSVEFQGMVLPNDKLYTQLKHIGMRGNGDKIVEIEVVNQQGDTVLKGRAIVAPPPTAYLFTGQGTAEVKMGMELYASSPAARKIWDSADRILLDKFGFSILEIVRKNPKTLTVHFGGRKGAAIRESYLNLQQEKTVTHADGTTTVERVQMIPEVTPTSLSYTFTSDQGLLFSTQFTQPAIVLFEKAAWEDMKSNGLIPTRGEHLYAGHSLGEYAVLCTAAESVPIERVVVVCFIRGLTMQRVVQRDSKGRSNFAMVAVDPSRVHVGFSEDYLHAIVDFIEEKNSTPATPALLQVVNYNVDRCQYVVAGDLSSLDVLSNTLTEIKKLAANPAALKVLTNREEIEKIIRQAISTTQGKLQASAENRIVLERGAATIPLRGIDVPFHSKYLLGGVQAFRERLSSMIGLEAVSPEMLIGRYIPNLVAQPFSLDRNYIELVQKKTGSSVLLDLLQKNDEELKGSATRRVIARFLLIELLAYQFASPVLWIETQNQIFFQKGVRRLVEVGPAATLAVMAKNTLLIKKKVESNLEVLPIDSCCITGAQAGEVYYRYEDQGPSATTYARSLSLEVPSEELATPAPTPITKPVVIPPATATPPVQQTVCVPLPTSSALTSSSQPNLQASEVLKTIVALNTKKTFQECGSDKSIKDLVGGKSALQNQIVGELQKEFEGSVESLENVSEMNLSQLAIAVSSGSSTLGLGKTTLGLVSKFISRKMPGGISFNNFRDMIQVEYDGVSLDGVILHSLLHEPKARFENEEEMKKWIETTVIPSYGSAVLNRAVNKRLFSAPSSFFAAAPQTHFQVAFPPSSPTAIEDQKVKALDFIRVLLALKLKKSLSEIPVDKSIGDIVGSKVSYSSLLEVQSSYFLSFCSFLSRVLFVTRSLATWRRSSVQELSQKQALRLLFSPSVSSSTKVIVLLESTPLTFFLSFSVRRCLLVSTNHKPRTILVLALHFVFFPKDEFRVYYFILSRSTLQSV